MRSPRSRAALLAVVVTWSPAVAGAKGLCAAAAVAAARSPYVAVVSAFPAELAPLVVATHIQQTVEADGRQYYLGDLEGVRVILGLTGIGILNAEARTRAVLANFHVAAVVMSGVAGSHYDIGDVVLADEFVERDHRRVLHANPALLALARRAAIPALENCTPVPPAMPGASIRCLPYEPMVVFGGRGVSGDDFGSTPFPCMPGAGEIFGCELPTPAVVTPAIPTEDVTDMETAAVARMAGRRGVPFLGVRAVSDGAGDPLGDRGFPTQFFDYYRLAARNAAAVTHAFIAEVGQLARDPSARRTCGLLARHRWQRAAARIAASQVRH